LDKKSAAYLRERLTPLIRKTQPYDQCVNRGIGPELLAHLAQVEHMIGIGSGHFDRLRLPYVFHEHHFTAVGSAAL
jgi:hypothetical protein